MTGIRIANIIVVLVTLWAVWERRLTFGSRWDAPNTIAIGMFGLGAALDSPWSAAWVAPFSFTGKYYVLMVCGHICYLVGTIFGLKSVYVRLLPDSAIEPFIRKRIVPPVILAAATMVVCFIASPSTSSRMPHEHPYLTRPDGWMTVYWVTYLATLIGLGIAAMYGVNLLRTDPRSVMLTLFITAQGMGVVSLLATAGAIIAGNNQVMYILAWPIGYPAIAAGSVALALAWRHRARSLTSRPPR